MSRIRVLIKRKIALVSTNYDRHFYVFEIMTSNVKVLQRIGLIRVVDVIDSTVVAAAAANEAS